MKSKEPFKYSYWVAIMEDKETGERIVANYFEHGPLYNSKKDAEYTAKANEKYFKLIEYKKVRLVADELAEKMKTEYE